MNFPCAQQQSACAPCSDFPIINTSAESSDSDPFIGIFWQPPTRGSFFMPGCMSICESTVSQADANECAARQAFDCSSDGAPDALNPLPSSRRFGNAIQSCDAECPDATCPQTAMVPGGTVLSAWQADANTRAHALACQRADDLLICFLTASPLPEGNVDAAYAAQIVTFGGTHTPAFSVVAGSLPPGLTLNSATGDLTGTPTTAASYAFTVRLTTPVATCERAFSLTVADACGPTTDWCVSPGACRLRVASFNAGDWTFAWDGNLPNKGVNFLFPCGGGYFDDTGFVGLTFNDSLSYWQLSILCPDFTTYLATLAGASPLGVYNVTGGSDPACVGPASFTIEAYTPP